MNRPLDLSRVFKVDALLGPGGVLSRAFDRYEPRPEQLRMAQAVERAFNDRLYLMAEAGTGTGKTLAYLVPAVLAGRKVVISTATKALQDQVFFKDIPLVKEALGLKFDATYLKGRSNYLCLLRLERFRTRPEFVTREEGNAWPLLRKWADITQTGDRAELDLPDAFATWSRLSTTSETCLGQKCELYQSCFVTRARRKAEESDVVVVNHHLFFADLALKRARGGGAPSEGVLPRYEAVVFDEAHALEDAATQFFGESISSRRVEDLTEDAQRALEHRDDRSGMLAALAVRVRSHSETFFHAIPRTLALRGEGTVRLTPTSLEPLKQELRALLDGLTALTQYAAGFEEPEVEAIGRRSAELGATLGSVAAAESADHVYWAEARGRTVFLRSAPIDVARELKDRLYGNIDTVVFASATLTAAGRFDYFARRMGLNWLEEDGVARVDSIGVASPFDFAQQAALYVPTHLPEPNDPSFGELASDEVLQLLEISGGRAFVLFTSLRAMEAMHARLKDRLPYQVLLQGEAPKAALLERFKEAPSVLFASHSFWEGIDVPGEALSLVVIDKLPFASPGDPLVAARISRLQERGEEPFSGYQLPEAAITLRQGFGRLIRTGDDFGIVAILDRRVRTKPYGQVFLRSLPKAKRFESLAGLQQWFTARALR